MCSYCYENLRNVFVLLCDIFYCLYFLTFNKNIELNSRYDFYSIVTLVQLVPI